MTTPADDTADYLLTQMPELVDGVSLRVQDPKSPVPVGGSGFLVTITNTQGLPSTSYVDGGRRGRFESPGISIHVRSDKNNPRLAEITAIRILEILSDQSFGVWMNCEAQGSGINRLGVDAEGYNLCSLNFILTRCLYILPRLRWGSAAAPMIVDKAFAESLASSMQSGSRFATFSTAGMTAGHFMWFVVPSTWGAPSFLSDVFAPLSSTLGGSYVDGDLTFNVYKILPAAPMGTTLVRVQ